MNFLNELHIRNEEAIELPDWLVGDKEEALCNGIRHCEWIYINENVALSIQASPFHYCTPKKLVPLEEYTEFELAIIIDGCINGEIEDLDKLFSSFSRYKELIDCLEYQVFAYVDKELINDFYIFCKENLQ